LKAGAFRLKQPGLAALELDAAMAGGPAQPMGFRVASWRLQPAANNATMTLRTTVPFRRNAAPEPEQR
jgi:hypothetical protein